MNNDFLNALLKSSGLHLALVVFLVIGSFFQPSTPTVMEVTLNTPANSNEPEQQAIEAVSVDQQVVEQRIQELKKQDAEKKAAQAKRIRDLERRAANAKKQREAETRRIAKLEKERKRKEREKKKADAAAREAKKKQKVEQKKADDASKKAAEAKKQAEQLAKQRKLEEEKLKKAEQKRKADAEAARQKALAEQMMQEQLAAEAAARNRAKQAQVLSEVEKYTALITAKIQQNLLFDENMKGKECRLNLRLAFNGLVTNVERLSGDKQVCDAAIRAVRRVETLPVSKDKAVFEELKNINLTIQPDI